MVLVLLWLYLCVQDALWGIWGGGEEGSSSRIESSAGKRKIKAMGQMHSGKKTPNQQTTIYMLPLAISLVKKSGWIRAPCLGPIQLQEAGKTGRREWVLWLASLVLLIEAAAGSVAQPTFFTWIQMTEYCQISCYLVNYSLGLLILCWESCTHLALCAALYILPPMLIPQPQGDDYCLTISPLKLPLSPCHCPVLFLLQRRAELT